MSQFSLPSPLPSSSFDSADFLVHVPPHLEHVVILGASSGVGRALAVEYARRGARVCVVARSRDTISEVQLECNTASGEDTAIAVAADFTSAEDMVALRVRLERGMMS